MLMSDFRPDVKILPFRACAMHPAIIIGTVRSLLTWLWGRYYVPQNVLLVNFIFILEIRSVERGICPIATSTINEVFL